MDIIVRLAKLCDRQTLNRRNDGGSTALDWAVETGSTSAALYLSWLGVSCAEENRKVYYTYSGTGQQGRHTYTEVTLQTWLEAGCQQEAQYWAIAANDIPALKRLARLKSVKLDKGRLRRFAGLFQRHEICHVWGDHSSLQDLAWERVGQVNPALSALPTSALLASGVPGHVVKVINSCKDHFLSHHC